MPQDSILFSSARARELLKRERLLARLKVVCPHCFQWDQVDRRLCVLCDGEEVVSAWEVVFIGFATEYLEPPWDEAKRKAYLEVLDKSSDPRWEALADALREQAGLE